VNLRPVILGSSLLLLAMPVFAREYTEVIVLKNGDRLTGNIKGSVRMCSTSIWIMWMARSRSNGQKWLTSKANSSSLDETSEKFWRRPNGNISFGTTYSKGNQPNQYNLSSQAESLREHWKAQSSFSSNLTSSSGANVSTRNQLGLGVFFDTDATY
jgi:hypothetical protein